MRAVESPLAIWHDWLRLTPFAAFGKGEVIVIRTGGTYVFDFSLKFAWGVNLAQASWAQGSAWRSSWRCSRRRGGRSARRGAGHRISRNDRCASWSLCRSFYVTFNGLGIRWRTYEFIDCFKLNCFTQHSWVKLHVY